MDPDNLLVDEFEESERLQKWVGITYITKDEEGLPILNEAIMKELQMGRDGLPGEFEDTFQIEEGKLLNTSLEFKKEWSESIRTVREDYGCYNIIMDEFSYPGVMRDWVGLS